ncbi:MAG: hypothetical protein GF346_11660 [Candidatus Eisenbacteria bacterium]|nr:hypothetical protein [Candidatus Latescibacterota bacterium]MBD3303093.1 hypothetical protein [Candidatus Eisenbacteria bacterium]
MQVGSEFLEDRHGSLSCISCHGGQSGIQTKEAAHVGMIADPSAGDAPACRECHAGIVERHAKSVHATQSGYFTMFEKRTGQTQVSEELRSMFDTHCAGCHTSCGQCHISRPTSVRGGLVQQHVVRRTPSQVSNCIACHGSRVGDEYRGRNSGIPPDVHYLPGNKDCFFCHTGMELHGDGTTPETRYEVDALPQCVDCHPEVLTDTENLQHSLHAGGDSGPPKLSCQVCHSVGYKNCYNCHVDVEERGLEHPSQIDFRIGRNPIPDDERRPWDYVVLRHVPIAPNSFEPWGVDLPQYAAEPTWKYATPHNIRRETPQNASCDACHEDENLFLTGDYIEALIGEGVMFPEERDANQDVIVEELP